MIQISPYHPEIDAIWHAVSSTGARSIAVVSSDSGEGAMAIAATLARRAALSASIDVSSQSGSSQSGSSQSGASQSGRPSVGDNPVLLVDLDVSRPSVSEAFELEHRVGEIVRLDAMGIAVLGAIGPDSIDAWRERARLAEQLKAWQSEWRLVVLNTAPLLTAERRRGRRGTSADRRPQAGRLATDIPGIVVAAAADACILVSLAGRTPANRVREACEILTAAGANLIGCVLNDRENPTLQADLMRETYRFDKFFPKSMASLRERMHRSPVLSARI